MKKEFLEIGNESLISREESLAIKGLMMLLIVFGHTGMLTTNNETGSRTFLFSWLYFFHVYSFFILPILYGYKFKSPIVNRGGQCVDIQRVVADIKQNVVRIGVPYFWFSLLSVFVFVTLGGGQFDFKGILYAFFFGNESLIDKYIGFHFVWFMPSMIAILAIKSVYYNSNAKWRLSIIVISVVLWFLAILKIVNRFEVGMYVPFAISQGFYFIIMGLVSRAIINKQWSNKVMMPIILLLAIVLTLILYKRETIHSVISIYYTLQLIMPITMFLLVYGLRRVLAKSVLLGFIGSYSLQIYLVHVFVINALTVLLEHFFSPNIGIGIIIYLLALGISCMISLIIVKVPTINKVLFPKA